MATFAQTVAAAEDGYTSWGGLNAGVVLGTDYGDTTLRTYWRYTGVTIPPGSTINSATLTLYELGPGEGALSTLIHAVDADNRTALNTYTKVQNAVLTTASTGLTSTVAAWGDGTESVVNVAAQVQEVIDRAGWASGNALAFISRDNGTTGNGYFLADEGQTYLDITYTPPAAPAGSGWALGVVAM